MLKYNIKYEKIFSEGIENLKLPDGKYKIYTSFSVPMLIKKQNKDILYGQFEIQNEKIQYLNFERKILDFYGSNNTNSIYKDLIVADNYKRLIIEKEENRIYYYYFDDNMKLYKKEYKNDDLDKFNKDNHNYFESEKYDYENLNNKMKEHINNYRLNLLSTFLPK